MTVGMIQARMGSTRLPGKVLLRAAGKTFLEHLVERLAQAETLQDVVMLTSTETHDDPIADIAKRLGIRLFRGSELDVLDRYYQAAVHFKIDHIIRITADCPLIDPRIVDRIVKEAKTRLREFDLVTNRYPLTFPDGMDVDAIPFSSLEAAWRGASAAHQREHVIPYFWEAGMRVKNVECCPSLFQAYRWTVDYPEDAALVTEIFETLYNPKTAFSMDEILNLLKTRPELSDLNSMYLPK